MATDEKLGFLESPQRVKTIVYVLICISLGLFIADIWIAKDHVYFAFEKGVGFYAVFGFVACVGMAFLARFVLRPLVSREEDYYE